MEKEQLESDTLSIYYHSFTLLELKEWIDNKLAKGHTKIDVNISWGYYNDIDGLELKTE